MRRCGYLISLRLPHWLPYFYGWGNQITIGYKKYYFDWLPGYLFFSIALSRARPITRARMRELQKKTGNQVTALKTLHVLPEKGVTMR
jgi:hypothetical protein